MRRALTDAEVAGISIGCLAAIAVAGLLGNISGGIGQANAALALVLVVVLASYTGGRWAGGFTGITASIAFDFFLTRPYQSLAITRPRDILTTGLLLAVGLAVGTIAGSRREARSAAQDGTEELAGLHRVALKAARDTPTSEIITVVEHEVTAILGLQRCQFQPSALDPTLPELDHHGRVEAPYVFEGNGFALSADGVSIRIEQGGQLFGWLACVPGDADHGVSRDQRRTALVLANQLALTLASDPLRRPVEPSPAQASPRDR